MSKRRTPRSMSLMKDWLRPIAEDRFDLLDAGTHPGFTDQAPENVVLRSVDRFRHGSSAFERPLTRYSYFRYLKIRYSQGRKGKNESSRTHSGFACHVHGGRKQQRESSG